MVDDYNVVIIYLHRDGTGTKQKLCGDGYGDGDKTCGGTGWDGDKV